MREQSTVATGLVACIDPSQLDPVPDEIEACARLLAAAAKRLETILPARTTLDVARFLQLTETHYSEEIEKYYALWLRLVAHANGESTRDPPELSIAEQCNYYSRHMLYTIELDKLVAEGTLPWPHTAAFVAEAHRRLYEGAPSSLLQVDVRPGQTILAQAGCFRAGPSDDIVAGMHTPPSGNLVGAFLSHWEQSYAEDGTETRSLVRVALAHHRLMYIHPFLFGNGKVARFVLRAALWQLGFGACGLWSVSRALSRANCIGPHGDEYAWQLRCANLPPEDERDGAGGLSYRRSVQFVVWFLDVCVQHLEEMAQILAPSRIVQSFARYAESKNLPSEAVQLVTAILAAGQLSPGDATSATSLPHEAGNDLIRRLLDQNAILIGKDSGTLRLKINDHATELFFPDL